MSRTHAHRSWQARLHREGVEVHDHSDGPCDLLSLEVYAKLARSTSWEKVHRLYRCHWNIDWQRTAPICGCRMCTSYYYNLWDRRRDRKRVRQLLRTRPEDA